MNSLVVLFSVMALTAASPSGLLATAPLTYSATVLAAAPTAVSSQSRLDIKSSPAVVSTSYAAAPVAYTAAAPIAPVGYIAPVAAAPLAYSASVVAAAPAAVSHQSRVDIKSSRAVVSTSYATAPVAYAAATPIAYSAPVIKTAAVATPIVATTGYAAPITTAAIAPGLPLDTPEVIAARAAHFEAHALAGAHLIKKRSASLFAAPVVSTYTAPIAPVAPYASYTPLTYSSPLITKAYSVHPW